MINFLNDNPLFILIKFKLIRVYNIINSHIIEVLIEKKFIIIY